MSIINGFCEKCNSFRKRHCDGDRNTCLTILFDRIEVLQHENDVIKDSFTTAEKAIQALQQKNEKLKAQVARMREALECVESDFVDGVGIVACAFCGKENAKERGHHEFCVVGKALTSIDTTDYHNPADVDALRKAREALDYWRELYGTGLEVLNWHMNGDTETFDSFYDNSGTYEALAEIDKVIGGKENV